MINEKSEDGKYVAIPVGKTLPCFDCLCGMVKAGHCHRAMPSATGSHSAVQVAEQERTQDRD